MITHIGNIIVTLLCLGFVVVIHEYGHLLVAKYFKVRIERFTVGFGPELVGWTASDNIRYSICAIPLGGMVKMAGEYVEERKDSPDEFFSKPWYQRIAIALAGPTMNYLLAFVLFALTAGIWGVLQPSSEAIIGDIVEGLPAAMSKLQPGDKILAINQTPITNWDMLARFIHERPDQKLTLSVERRDAKSNTAQSMQILLTPQKDPASGVGLIGVVPKFDKVKPGVLGSLKAASRDIKAWTMQPLRYIAVVR
jgi:regulator of sigma E protease